MIVTNGQCFAGPDEFAPGFSRALVRHADVFEFRDALETGHTRLSATKSQRPASPSARELGKREDIQENTVRIIALVFAGLQRR
jgi:hypothetical protein